jgi:DoxX-like family
VGIYVEIFIRGTMDEVWRLTQTPKLHERWDLRFSSIDYLPRPDTSRPQRFQYSTRIGFGMVVKGEGETSAVRDTADGSRTTSLTFWSEDPKSLILKGSGYWRYEPVDGGVRFITGYDYKTRFGALGRVFDAIVFRPLLGWATAWSFDRLRLWIEESAEPEGSLQRAAIYALARVSIAFVFLYHGIVPKLVRFDQDEQHLMLAAGVANRFVPAVLHGLGLAEMMFGALLLLAWRARWLFVVTILLMVAAIGGVAITSPEYLVRAFNPVTLNVPVIALSIIGLLVSRNIPASRTCSRKKAGAQ